MIANNPEVFYQYRQLNIDNTPITPQKLRRRLNILKKWSESFEMFYPKNFYKQAYWNFKLPILNSIVSEDKVSFEIKKECIQYLVNAVVHVINARKQLKNQSQSKIMCLISLPDMFNSEITIFIDKQYYNEFFLRNHPAHKWVPIQDPTRSIIKEYDIKSPKMLLEEKGYFETIDDEDTRYTGELWSIGQLGTW